MNLSNTWKKIETTIKARGHAHYGFASLANSPTIGFYRDWLARGFNGEMKYLEKSLERAEPERLLSKAQSAIVIGFSYVPHPRPRKILGSLKIARYARGEDYHDWLRSELESIATELSTTLSQEQFKVCVDTSAILERDLAYSAGLGWFGKNTCLIDRKLGSFFLLGEILTTLPLATTHDTPPHDFCGTCTRCIDVCPTQALVAPRVLDARKCISYWTIESRVAPPEEIRAAIGDWFFGCDLCQSVCPWNKDTKTYAEDIRKTKPEEVLNDLRWILTASNREIDRMIEGTALMRAGSFGLRKNAILLVGNLRIRELLPELKEIQKFPKLAQLAEWAMQQNLN